MLEDFFNVVTVQDFLKYRYEFSPVREVQDIQIQNARDRILALDLYSPEDLPQYSRSCMDGFAVQASDLFGASEFNPVYLECVESIPVNVLPRHSIEKGQCSQLSTGSILPQGADSVVMLEYCNNIAENEIEVRCPLSPGDNVMQRGEDCSFQNPILSRGINIRPQEVGLLAALGFSKVPVFRSPSIGVISTGDELVDIGKRPEPGQIRDVNSCTLHSWILKTNSVPVHYGIVSDNRERLQSVIQRATSSCDMVLISGGSSVGTRDITLQCFQELGEVLVHGVSISPGKPTILADIDCMPVIGLPGQVTSALIVMFVLVLPYIFYLSGETNYFFPGYSFKKTAELKQNVASKPGREDYVRVYLDQNNFGYCVAYPILGKSGLLYTMVNSDGLIKIPSNMEGLKKGSLVDVFIL